MPIRHQRRTRNTKIKYYKDGGLPQTKDGIVQIGARRKKRQEGSKLNLDFLKQLVGTALQFTPLLLYK